MTIGSLDTVYEALFGFGAVHDCLTRGDEYYGINDWNKPFNEEKNFLIKEISQHVITASNEITIHKVWKLQESNHQIHSKISGDLMFGMESFDIIDFMNKSKFIMISKERGTPSVEIYNQQSSHSNQSELFLKNY